jgi:protein-L-isoaspartate(D-aspartate) O-methyltransferase
MVADQLVSRGVAPGPVTEAMLRIPRHLFVPFDHQSQAYGDCALPSLAHQTISQPYMVAVMTEGLHLERHHRVLEIGTGTGYQTAILAVLAGEVYTIERVPELATQAQERLGRIGLANVRFRVGDGSLGWPEIAPFDRIIVTAAMPSIPEPLLDQLADGGILVGPLGGASVQTLVSMTRDGTAFHQKDILDCRFVPLLGRHGWDEQAWEMQKHEPE